MMKESNNQDEYLNKIDFKLKNLSLNNIYINIKILSQIEENDKLIISNNLIIVDKRCVKSLQRWYNSQSRRESINHIIHIINSIENYINDPYHPYNNDMKNKLLKDLPGSLKGLTKLKKTYIEDIVILSEIDFVIDKIKDILKLLETSS